MDRIYNELLFHLKKYLDNDNIQIHPELIKEDQSNENMKLYTDEEKYNYLQKKNKYLRKLRQDFDLDFD
ncbi:MAG: hypothetical protein K9H65_03740 [Bacteroidales bacterium]|nr:hypothetical protein [Bacteroidales bacterium]